MYYLHVYTVSRTMCPLCGMDPAAVSRQDPIDC